VFRFSARPNRANLIGWYDWSEATFRKAQKQDKLILLLICAYWCGSCQRLDETTLSEEGVINVLNQAYIPIRVEESQRPDIDLRYTQNGWPTISILTPTGKHLFSLPALAAKPFIDILTQTNATYQTKKFELLSRASVESSVNNQGRAIPARLKPTLVGDIVWTLQRLTDSKNGGYGIESKFPNAAANDFFLYIYETTGEREFLDYVLLTLRKMRESKMWHEEGSGFYRYSSRSDWRQPHPEKLLDDQAGLLINYLHAYLLIDDSLYRDTATELIEYLNETLLDAETGMLFGCQDYIRRISGLDGMNSHLDSYLDQCIYCDQNARAASAYFQAWWLLGRKDCKARAEHILEWTWQKLRQPDAGMYHFFFDGELHTPGMLQDCTAFGSALLDAYACTENAEYMRRAFELALNIIRRHRSESGGFYDIDHTGPGGLATRLVTPTQNANVAAFFVRLADLSGEDAYRAAAYWALWPFEKPHEQYGVMAAGFGHALARYLGSPVSAIVVGLPGAERVRELARAALTKLGQPDLVLRFSEGDGSNDAWIEVTSSQGVSESLYEPELLTTEMLAGQLSNKPPIKLG
jgi:uncharacterized protein YyaL (SSP411 family)